MLCFFFSVKLKNVVFSLVSYLLLTVLLVGVFPFKSTTTYSLSQDVRGQPPLSVENAVGVILVHGESVVLTDYLHL